MAGILHIAVRLLLLYFIRTGVCGDQSLTFAERSYDVRFPCGEELVCSCVWHFSAGGISDYVALVINGEIQTSEAPADESECTLHIKDVTPGDIGCHRCQQRPGFFSSYSSPSAVPGLNIVPSTVSLQCVLLTYIEQGHCHAELQQDLSLMWVDGSGAPIQEDSQHQIKQQSSCDVTLIVTRQSPENRKFRCQVTVDEHTWTSVELLVRGSAFRGRGSGLVVEPASDHQAGGGRVAGAAVGVVGCAVLTALIAAFVVNRRRAANTILYDESSMTTNNDVSEDDVIYADVILPAAGSARVQVQDCTESTEYVSVRYH